MGFSKKIQDYFAHRGLSNRDVSRIMEGYNETLISKFVNSDNLSITFIKQLIKYFPDVDLNYLLKDDDIEDPNGFLVQRERELQENIEKLEGVLDGLKKNLYRN